MVESNVRRIEERLAVEIQVVGYEPTKERGTHVVIGEGVGKIHRAGVSSLKRLEGGLGRQKELSARLRSLRRLYAIQRQVKRYPRRIDRDPRISGDE
jgi:hypothetical protein